LSSSVDHSEKTLIETGAMQKNQLNEQADNTGCEKSKKLSSVATAKVLRSRDTLKNPLRCSGDFILDCKQRHRRKLPSSKQNELREEDAEQGKKLSEVGLYFFSKRNRKRCDFR